MIDQLIIVSVVSVLLLVVAGALRLRKKTTSGLERKPLTPTEGVDTVVGWPPQATRILSTPERNAHDLLIRALPGYMIFAQLPLSRFIKVPTHYSYAQWLRRVGRHCVDLVVADQLSRVIAVIEIRATQKPEKALRRQERVARVLETANIPMYEWVEGDLPSLAKVRDLFRVSEAQALKASTHGVVPTAIAPAAPVDPSTVNFYIANEALPESAPAQQHDTLVDEPLPEVTELSVGETEAFFEPASLAKGIGHVSFSSINLDLPELLPLASTADAQPTEAPEVPPHMLEESTTLTLVAPATLWAEPDSKAVRETLLVEHLLLEEASIDPTATSLAPESPEGVPSLENSPTTRYGELEIKGSHLNRPQEETTLESAGGRQRTQALKRSPIESIPA